MAKATGGRGFGLSPEGLAVLGGLLSAASSLSASAITVVPLALVHVDAVAIEGDIAQSAVEFRRVRAGLRGTVGPSVRWVAELDLARGASRFTNLFVTLQPASQPISLAIGQSFPPSSLETASGQNGASFLERAQLHDLFEFGRRFGAVVALEEADVLLTASAFGDNLRGSYPDGSRLVALRAVWAPVIGEGRLHLGGNIKWRAAGDPGILRYAALPATALAGSVLLDSGRVQASGDTNAGVELAGIFGPLNFAGEVQHAWLHDTVPGGLSQVTAGYAEIGWYLTEGDSKAYSIGRFGRTLPVRPLGKGGAGAWQISMRGDWAVAGARQRLLATSLNWTASDAVRLLAQVSRVRYQPGDGSGAKTATIFGLRTQLIY